MHLGFSSMNTAEDPAPQLLATTLEIPLFEQFFTDDTEEREKLHESEEAEVEKFAVFFGYQQPFWALLVILVLLALILLNKNFDADNGRFQQIR